MVRLFSSVLWKPQFLVSVLLCGAAGSLLAQDYDDPALGQQPVVAQPQDYKPLGIRAGTFMLHPGVELATEWTDNAFYDNDNEQSDTIYHVRPYVTAQSTWSRHSFAVRAAADVARYDDFGFRDYEDLFFTFDGRVDVMARSSFSYRFDWLELHEDLNNRNSEQGLEPTSYTFLGGGIGYDQVFNRFSLGLTTDLHSLNFDDVRNEQGDLIDNQDRDRSEWLAGIDLGYQFKTDKRAFLALNYGEVDYDQSLDRNGFERSSQGYSASAGLDFSITGILLGDVSFGYHRREYDDPQLQDIDGWGLDAGLSWYPTQLTSLRANVATSIEDTTSGDASGYLRTLYSLRVDHELLRDVQVNGRLSYTDSDYEVLDFAPDGSRSSDKVWRAGVGANWFINRWMFLGVTYDYQKLDSNVASDDYEVNRVWLLVGFER